MRFLLDPTLGFQSRSDVLLLALTLTFLFQAVGLGAVALLLIYRLAFRRRPSIV